MAANLAPNVGGGFTWQEKATPAPEATTLEGFQRGERAVEAEARKLFAASTLAADEGWTTITEQEREKFRVCARASLRTAGPQ